MESLHVVGLSLVHKLVQSQKSGETNLLTVRNSSATISAAPRVLPQRESTLVVFSLPAIYGILALNLSFHSIVQIQLNYPYPWLGHRHGLRYHAALGAGQQQMYFTP